MHTILEFNTGKLANGCRTQNSSSPPPPPPPPPSSLFASRTNKSADSSLLANSADQKRPDSDQGDRLESVQLILRACETLQRGKQLHCSPSSNRNGYNGRASMATNGNHAISGFIDTPKSPSKVFSSHLTVNLDHIADGHRIGGCSPSTPDHQRHKQNSLEHLQCHQQQQHLKRHNLQRNPEDKQREKQQDQPTMVHDGPPDVAFNLMPDDERQFEGPTNGCELVSTGADCQHSSTTTDDMKTLSLLSSSSPFLEEVRCHDQEEAEDEEDKVGFFLQENSNGSNELLENHSKNGGANRKCASRIGNSAAMAAAAPPPFNSFAGFRNYMMPERAICGTTGTIRGMRNRVRAGIATFKPGNLKNLHQLECGKVVVYTTSTGIVRETFQQCLRVKMVLNTLLIGFEERDIFKCRAYQRELSERLNDQDDVDGGRRRLIGYDTVRIPQVFVEGYYLGNANVIEELNESGRLRKILRPYQKASDTQVCQKCGGYLLLLCPACNGSKKSLTRNPFTNTLLPLRCTKCDECGLVPCDTCCSSLPTAGHLGRNSGANGTSANNNNDKTK